MSDWKKACHSAIDRGKGLSLVFNPTQHDLAHHGGPCRLVGAAIEAGIDYDEESLPIYFIESVSGERIEAFSDELECEDQAGLNALIAGVCMTFGLARNSGRYAGPAHLMADGSPEEKARFLDLLHAGFEEKLAAMEVEHQK